MVSLRLGTDHMALEVQGIIPQRNKYRRTLREEADALHSMVMVLMEQKDFEKKKKDLDPALLQLVKIDQAGFIEPFALLNRADGEIA